MTENSFLPLRRALLGAMFASVALPRHSFAQQRNMPTSQEPTDMRIRLTFNNQSMTATLYDNPSARDLMSLLPLDLTIDDYGNNEKIAYLPRKLTEEGSGPFGNESARRSLLLRAVGQSGAVLCRLSMVGGGDPPRPLRGQLRAPPHAGKIPAQDRTHSLNKPWQRI